MNDQDQINSNEAINGAGDEDQAVKMVRAKIAGMFGDEPSAEGEQQEIQAEEKVGIELSRHQEYLKHLYGSQRSPEEIKSAWHSYYSSLNDAEKLEVWKEYNDRAKLAQEEPVKVQPSPQTVQTPSSVVQSVDKISLGSAGTSRTGRKFRLPKQHWSEKQHVRDEQGRFVDNSPKLVKKHLLKTVESARQVQSHPLASKLMTHVKAAGFALSVGTVFMFIMFNQILIGNVKAWVSPGTAYTGPVIKDRTDIAVSSESRIIIPSIAADVPVVVEDYDVSNEAEHQKRLENGVVHIPGTALPGQKGNVAIIGHSANNFFVKGDYKFAFVWLRKMEIGDTFQLNYGGKLYIYSVYEKKVVNPSETGVIYGPTKDPFTVTLITCDPPGNNTNRLIVQGKQVYPEPDTKQAAVANTQRSPTVLPSNPKTLWSKIFN
jgi:LPXTG-site transpeptidase (sortase) family protein